MSTVPRDLRGRPRPDRAMRLLQVVSGAYTAVGRSPGRGPRPVDRTLRLVVTRRDVVAEGVVALRIGAPDGAALPRWQPGCHLDVHLRSGLRRQYSLTGDPADRTAYVIAVRLLGEGSAQLHALTAGDAVDVRGPRNAFPFVPRPRMLFVAGGIGITPIAPMVRAAARLGISHRLVYAGRHRASMPFLSGPDSLAADVLADDERGVPTAADLLPGEPDVVYACGPPPMLALIRAALPAGVALHTERFSPPPVVGGRPFTLALTRSGTELAVPADRTALDVLRAARPEVAYSCRQGFCGTCRIGAVLPCVDRPATDRLEIDL